MRRLIVVNCMTALNSPQDPYILPQFLHASVSLSVATDLNYLHMEEESTLTKNDEKAIDNPKLIMDRFLNGCHQRVWESSHESLSNVHPSSTQEQGSSKLTDLHCADTSTGAVHNHTYPVSSKSNFASDSGSVAAQRYTLDTNQQHKLDNSITKYSDDNHTREFTPSSVPTESYFTDDDGYLRVTNETALTII